MERLSGMNLPPEAVVSSRQVKTVCECKESCFVDAECRGCASEPLPGGGQMCHFTNTNLTSTNLTSANGSVAFIKHGMCDAPYVIVEGVGCIFVSKQLMNFSDAVSRGCPPGFRLFDPVSDQEFWNVASYLRYQYARYRPDGKCGPSFPLSDGAPAACDTALMYNIPCCLANGTCAGLKPCTCDGCVDFKALTRGFWTSLTKIGTEWKFANGRVIPSAVNSSVWGPNEPKANNLCAAMWNAPQFNYFYNLAALQCNTTLIPFVCHRKI
ncbi:uncharacterized protein LOC125179099 [Hyalella azteca]|uniref:Uncharacterized protein LOC125179099 n=1 Tax=Hyalella azteca TaxID=294128 RepID=A0A979FSQ7_HYAAZ|nr:uncharacterized protein LOC125179099 [Hyalella azteca]